MSVYNGPKIDKSGLVFHIDSGNTQKSWKGLPSTNLLYYSDTLNGGLWSGYCGSTANTTYNTTDYKAPDGSFNATKIVMDGSTTCNAGTAWGFFWNQTATMTSDVTYTASLYIRADRSTSVTLGLNDSYGTSVSVTNEWQRITFTATPSGTGAVLNRGLQFYRNSATAGLTFYVWGAQCEAISFATPYISSPTSSTSRSNTQAILDLTKNSTLTASSLTYNSNGTFSFNGTSNYISCNSPVKLPLGTVNSTVLVWCKPDSTGPSNQYTGLVSYGGRASVNPSNSRLLSLYTSAGTMYVSSAYWGNDYIPNTLAVRADSWNMVGMISRGAATTNNVTLISGNSLGINFQTGSSSNYTYGLNTTLSNLAIGCTDYPGRYFKGEIGAVLIFNRELSQTEIIEIFNAYRTRFYTYLDPVVNLSTITSLSASNIYFTAGPAVYIQFNSDGSVLQHVDATNGGAAAVDDTSKAWANTVTAGIGANYWIRFTVISGGGTGATASTGWLQLNTARQINVQKPSGSAGTLSAVYLVEISSNSAGTSIVGTRTGIVLSSAAQNQALP